MEEKNNIESINRNINELQIISEKFFREIPNDLNPNKNEISYLIKNKKFDLNEHLFNYLSKLNFLSYEKDSKKENYCTSCKLFYLENSNIEHTDHEVIDYKKDLQNIDFFTKLFETLETKFFNSFTEDLNVFDCLLKKRIEDSIEKLMNNLNNLKKSKIEDMENLLKNYKFNFEKIKKDFFELKYKFVQFYKKNDTFLNISRNTNNKNINQGNKKNQSTPYKSETQKSSLIIINDILNNNSNDNFNLLNNSINKLGGNNLNSTSLSIINSHKSNRNSNNLLENKILNDVFYLINLDLNKIIELTENRLETFLDTEKNKIKSQSDILQNLFEDFINKINEFKLLNKINPIGKNEEDYENNRIPDFTHSLHLRLKKYTEILDNLNFTIMEIKNPSSYKKIESLIGNMENDILYKFARKNAQGNTNSRIDYPEILYDMEFGNIVDNLENLEYDIKSNENNKININKGNQTSKNQEKNDLKKIFNFDSKKLNINSRSDNKKLDKIHQNNHTLNKNIQFNCEFNLNSNVNNQNYNCNNNDNGIKKNKKNLSLNLDKINLTDNNNILLNSSSYNSNINSSINNENLSNTINNISMINNSVQNKSCLSVFKNKDELLRKYLILSLMGTYEEIQEIEEENENIICNNNDISNKSKFEKFLKEKDYLNHLHDPIVAKIIENTNEILIYDKKTFSIRKYKISLNKDLHGIENFLDGCRTVIAMDKIFIIGGRDALNQHSHCLEYDFKLDFIKKIQNMKNPRAYHSLVFNPLSVKILAIGGENNKTCEEYDLFKGVWTELPNLNIPRAYISCYLNRQNNFLYALFGMKNEITKNNFNDSVEVLDLGKRDKGWIKIEYTNKSDINLKNKYVHVFPIEADKLLIVGNCFSRYNQKNFAVYDMKIDNIAKIDSGMILEIRRKSRNNPALKRLLVEIHQSLN